MDSRDPDVAASFETDNNPQKELVQAARRIILDADPSMMESIKWNAPTFLYKGSLASFCPESTQHACTSCSTRGPRSLRAVN